MKRRELLTSLGIGFGGLISLPSWANNWTQEAIKSPNFLNAESKALLSEICNTIIPKTDTPGALEVGVPDYIELIVKDCLQTSEQESFKKGMLEIEEIAKETFGKSFVECNAKQKLHLLNGLDLNDDQDLKKYFSQLKWLTIRGYTSSEYYLVNVKNFEFAPARYFGCVDLKK
jgi:hypothetical protein